MRLSKLYIKIFLAFLVVFTMAEILIFGLFIVIAGHTFHDRVRQLTRGKVLVARAYLDQKLGFRRYRRRVAKGGPGSRRSAGWFI